MDLNFLLFSAPNIPEKMLMTCEECGEKLLIDGGEPAKKKCKCGRHMKLRDPLIMSGLYCWTTTFREQGGRGVMRAVTQKDYLEQFDIVMVNWTPGHPSYLAGLKESLGESDTKLVACVDYATSMWGNIDPFLLKNDLKHANVVFHVTESGATRLGKLLSRTVPVIPHPVDVKRIKLLRTQPSWPPVATCQYHRYWGTWVIYYYAMMEARKAGVRSMLCNVSGEMPRMISPEVYFDEVIPSAHYIPYMKDVLAKAFVNLDATPDKTYGRGVIEAAALGIPTIGSPSIEAIPRLFPELCINDQDDDTNMSKLLMKIVQDKEFAKQMSDQGQERCTYYDCQHAYERMVTAIES